MVMERKIFGLLIKADFLSEKEKEFVKEEANKRGILIDDNDRFTYRRALLKIIKQNKK